MYLDKTDPASETGNIDELHNIHEGEGNTETPSTSKEHDQHDQQQSGNTELLSLNYPSQKENTDEEFQA